ncbi:MAG TPA: hypothetical protein VN947_00665 [Polyangia bacterium]|nr:hypothetical protein [Polyangia bacterium]
MDHSEIETKLEGINTTLTIRQIAPAVVLLKISGSDYGELGTAPFHVLEKVLREGPFSLFIDARATKGASVDVSNVWAQWLRKHRDDLVRIHMLTASRYVQLTADFVRRFADLGDAMLIYTDPRVFDETLEGAAHRRKEIP